MAIFDVIKKKKDNDSSVWKYPKTNFNTGSSLVVNESQEAIFYSCGKALDLFGPGKHTLSTNNIPLLRTVINIPTGFRTPFTCEVYFIDKTVQTFKWGTNSKIEFMEPKYNFPIKIGACGEIRFTIEDSRKFITKLVGIKKDFTSANIDEFFSSYIMMSVKTYIAQTITNEKISIFEIDQELEKFSNEIKDRLKDELMTFGIDLQKFIITNIAKPEDDKQYLEFKELFFKQSVAVAKAEINKKIGIIEAEEQASRKVIDSEALAQKRANEGYSYQEEQSYKMGNEMAKNEAIGQFSNIGLGMGMISGVSNNVGQMVNNKVTTAFTKLDNEYCPNCGTPNDKDSLFCKKCGNKLEKIKICPKCNNSVSMDSVFCSKCGEKLV